MKKGTATMTFSAKPESGYSGSFKKTFKVTPANISDTTHDDKISGTGDNLRLEEAVSFVKGGVKPSEHITLINSAGIRLKKGTDYTIKYANNKVIADQSAAKQPCMTITGKGNYTGSLKVYFTITKAKFSSEQVVVNQLALNTKGNYEYKPSVKIVDSVSGKVLSANNDYKIEYENNGQSNVTKYVSGDEGGLAPKVVITVPEAGYYELTDGIGKTDKIEVPLPVYKTKLTSKNLYVVVSETFYTGEQLTPNVTVYYSENASAIKKARNGKVNDEAVLTNPSGEYKFTKLEMQDDADTVQIGSGAYLLTYGVNIVAGKNKGSIIVTGSGIYGGSVTVKFDIIKRTVYK